MRAKGSRGFLGVTALGPERNSVNKRRTLRIDHSSSGPSVFTFFAVKSKLFTTDFAAAAKLFTVGCGDSSAPLAWPPMNNFGIPIRMQPLVGQGVGDRTKPRLRILPEGGSVLYGVVIRRRADEPEAEILGIRG